MPNKTYEPGTGKCPGCNGVGHTYLIGDRGREKKTECGTCRGKTWIYLPQGSAATVPACKGCGGTGWILDEATGEKEACRYCTTPQGPVPVTQANRAAADAFARGQPDPLAVPATGIKSHEGSKYLRTIHSCLGEPPIGVDVYAVLKAFGVTCPAAAHAVKKLLCAGTRGKGDRRADLVGALAAVSRALELHDDRESPRV